MGRRRRAGDLEGVLVVDKPRGPTSHDVVRVVRRAADQHRVGHTGTLDPAATGVLVLCLGRATRLVPFLQAGTKTYQARMVLGVETTSQDADGEVVASTDASHIDERTLCEALVRFQGEIEQIPPMVSAVKVGGERLHVKARRGEQIDREPRRVQVHALVLEAFEPGPNPEASFLVTCSAGTYVRTLAHDLGRELGVGGSLVALRRLANGPFAVGDAHSLADLEGADREAVAGLLLTPAESMARALPRIEITEPDLVGRLVHGGRLPVQGQSGPYGVHAHGRLVGVYVDGDDEARPEVVWTRPEELV